MVVVKNKTQVEVVLLFQPPEAVVKGIWHAADALVSDIFETESVPAAKAKPGIAGAVNGLHAVAEGGGSGRVHGDVGSNEAVSDARAAADLVDGLVGGVEDDASTELTGEGDLLFTGELALLDLVGQVGVEERVRDGVTNGGRWCCGRQQRRRLEAQRAFAETGGDVVRGDAVLAGSAALLGAGFWRVVVLVFDVLCGDGVVVLIYAVDGAGSLGKAKPFESGEVLK